ncbi:restriction endonuclease subunit S [Bradyrhizobium sp. I1.8.5]|uniref:restriction endonuclease subunit S n=1 Tax=Bradyrhizobium sp. I1.8.5 TaxID=3156365 RepID=UPI0033940089
MRVCRIGDVASVQSGFAFKSAEFKKTGVRLLRNTNILPQRVYWDELACLDANHYASYPEYQLHPGDLLISLDRPIISSGIKVARVGEADLPALLVQRVGRLKPDLSAVDPDYLYGFLQSPKFIDAVSGHDQSLGVPHISPGQVESVQLNLPDLFEQSNIVATLKAQLAAAETARQAARMLLQDAAALRARVLREALTRHASAPRKVLGEHAHTTSGSTPSRSDKRYWQRGEIPWVKTSEVAFAPIKATEELVSRLALADCSLTLLPPKTVLVAMYGQGKTRGQSAILEIEAATNQACFAILPNETWEPEFLYFWLMSSYQNLRNLSDDRGGNQANLNGALLNALEIPTPASADQHETVLRIKAAFREIDALASASKMMRDDLDKLPPRILAQAFET